MAWYHHGTKQEDPLSPLLFLEPLATAIRAESSIKGVVHGEEEHKMFLYADDILLIIEDPLPSIPNILATIVFLKTDVVISY